uniref:Putative secreted protein n=1 Tax=Anopheles darlingi TaxID=43151 RepID=A0A2M4DL07_ANODA
MMIYPLLPCAAAGLLGLFSDRTPALPPPLPAALLSTAVAVSQSFIAVRSLSLSLYLTPLCLFDTTARCCKIS